MIPFLIKTINTPQTRSSREQLQTADSCCGCFWSFKLLNRISKFKIKNGWLHATWLQNHNVLGWCGTPEADFDPSIWLPHRILTSLAGGEQSEPTTPGIRLLWRNQSDVLKSAFGVSSSSSNLEQGGLEIPAKIIFHNSNKRIIEEMKKRLAPLIEEYNKKH